MRCQLLSFLNKCKTFSISTLIIIALLVPLAYILNLVQSISDFLHDIESPGIVQQRPDLLHFFSNDSNAILNRTGKFNGGAVGYDNQSTRNEPCQRYCPIRINKICYIDNPAGLGDRIIILRGLSQLAGYLCAEVIMPPPKEHLSVDHNFGKPISEEIQWSDFINITFLQDGSPTIKNAKTLGRDGGINISSWSNIPAFNLSGSKYKDWLHVVSKDGKMRDDFEKVQRFSFEQPHNATTGFIWEIHKQWYSSDLWLERFPDLDLNEVRENAGYQYRKEMRPYVSSYYRLHQDIKREDRVACMYANQSSPMQLAMMQKRLLGYIVRHSPNNAIFGTLHLRRGDAIGDCDTSVETMRQYFACSLEKTETLGRNITLLMTSDEEDVQYRQSIIELIKDYPHVSMLDADDIAWKLVREAGDDGIVSKALENNYYIFQMESILRDRMDNSFVKFRLRRRRSHCRSCMKVAKRLNSSVVT